MRLPRITMRQWMVAVAVVGIVLGVTTERRKRFKQIADYHQAEFVKLSRRMKPFARQDRAWHPLEWHERMERKYERAAAYPWLPVQSDPPRPEL
jgi:hypothetical protein